MQDDPGRASSAIAYEGQAWPLFWLAVRTLVLTVLTLGIYRFWMKTRLRRYYWSAIRIEGEPLEYTGRAVELLLGFLLAVVFLAIYLGVVNLALTFIGISYFQGHPAALNLSFLALAPVIFYAQYRARRFLLSRTRWRGIRFAAEHGAVGYAWRACLYMLASIASLGLLAPWMQFRLAKFSLDRTWWGDRQFLQRGSWTGLLGYWLWALAPVLLGAALFAAWFGPATNWFEAPIDERVELQIAGAAALLLLVWIATSIYYNARAFRYLNSNRTLGRSISLRSDLKARRVFGVYLIALIGFLVAGVLVLFSFGVFGVLAAYAAAGAETYLDAAYSGLANGEIVGYAIFAAIVAIYLLMFALFSALTHLVLHQPMLRLFAQSLVIEGANALDRVHQRSGEDLAEAEGFADALDVGAAF